MTISKYLKNPRLIARKIGWAAMYYGPRREVTLDTFNGRLTFDSRDKLIGRYLYMQRAYEADWLAEALALLRADGLLPEAGSGTVLDVGANIGMICIPLLKQGHFARALAFEPVPGNYSLLEKNIAQNGLTDRIIPRRLALSSSVGEMQMELSDYNSGDHRIRMSASAGAFGEEARKIVTAPVDTLDGFAAANPDLFRDTALVWLDIQGHEGHFIEGALATLSRNIPVVSEFWPYGIERSGMSRSRYMELVSGLFTHVYVLDRSGMQSFETGQLDALFGRLTRHTDMRQMVLVNR